MSTQQSLIFELLEQVEASSDHIARLELFYKKKRDSMLTYSYKYRYHFQQLAEDNEAVDATVATVDVLKPEYITPLLP
jgi:hypothetical protein